MSLDKRERIVHLLRTLKDVRDASAGTESFGDMSHDRLLLLSDDYHRGSYAELERCLGDMNTDAPCSLVHECGQCGRRLRSLRFHVVGYFGGGWQVAALCTAGACRSLSRSERQFCARPEHLGHKKPIRLPIVVRTALPDVAALGLDWIEETFRGEPFLPPALFDLVADPLAV